MALCTSRVRFDTAREYRQYVLKLVGTGHVDAANALRDGVVARCPAGLRRTDVVEALQGQLQYIMKTLGQKGLWPLADGDHPEVAVAAVLLVLAYQERRWDDETPTNSGPMEAWHFNCDNRLWRDLARNPTRYGLELPETTEPYRLLLWICIMYAMAGAVCMWPEFPQLLGPHPADPSR